MEIHFHHVVPVAARSAQQEGVAVARGEVNHGVEILVAEQGFDPNFIAHIGARQFAAGLLLQRERAIFIVPEIGDDAEIRLDQSANEGAAERSGGARHQNPLLSLHFCGEGSLSSTLGAMKMWLNGTLLPGGGLDASSAGITLGWGVFTTVGIRGGAARFLPRHFERLGRDAGEAQISFDFDFETVSRAVGAVASANGVANGIARLTLTQRGDGRWNRESGADFSIFASAASPPEEPMRVQLSPYRVEARRALAGVKTTSYLPYFWAWREAQSNGFGEAILRDGDDYLSEGARASLFWVKEGELFTPSLQTGCLRGIGRDLTLQWARERSIAPHEGRFLAGEVENADEMWLVSAAQGPRFVSSWHDETGVSRREWGTTSAIGRDLRAWWEKSD